MDITHLKKILPENSMELLSQDMLKIMKSNDLRINPNVEVVIKNHTFGHRFKKMFEILKKEGI